MGIMGIYVRTSVEKDNTSIDQQKKLGIQFAEKSGFEYQIYEDVGKSGYTIDDDDPNPFNNRPAFTSLVNDIKNKKISKVWVYEHSRISRNQYGSAIIFNVFDKYNIELYENNKFIDLKDSQYQFMRQVMDAVAQLERNLIVNRTTRGLHHSINQGFRGIRECYGYKKDGKNERGYTVWKPVESEIENIKYFYEKYLEGKSVNSIVSTIHKNEKLTEEEKNNMVRKWRQIIGRFQNTGHLLNTDGLEILKKFQKGELNSLKELNNEKYRIKSTQFPVQIISIEDWITAVEKQKNYNNIHSRNRKRSANTEMATGIIQCPYCESKYYFVTDKGLKYYKHEPKFSSCGQKPKSMKMEKLDNILHTFFFYFYLIYDDTKALIEESQKLIKLNQLEIKEKIKNKEAENKRVIKQIENFQSIYEKPENMENIDKLNLILDKETQLKTEKRNNDDVLLRLKNELDELIRKYNKDELEFTYHDVKKAIIDFFEKLSVGEKRTALIKIIRCCQLFKKYLVIDTGKLLFVFNIEEKYILSEETYNQFKTDDHFKKNFILKKNENENKKPREGIEIISESYFLRNQLDNITINEYRLKDEKTKSFIKDKFQELKIAYPLDGVKNVLYFTGDK